MIAQIEKTKLEFKGNKEPQPQGQQQNTLQTINMKNKIKEPLFSYLNNTNNNYLILQ